jgi:D-alanine-D-alanine ligase
MTREVATPVEANDIEREANMKLGRIGVLMGGVSAEREVSLKTGSNVADALERRGHEVVRIDWGADARSIDELLREAKVDRVVLALHGRGGEDGCVQGYLELMGIPYTGSNVLASALAMDKLKAKELFRLHNVPTPPYYSVSRRTRAELEDLHGTFGFPVIVKPRSEGSSVGLAKANSMEELTAGVDVALAIDDHVLIERFVSAKEIAVAILDGRVLGCIEIAPKSGLYDYHSKYTAGATEYILPPRIPATRLKNVMTIAERAAEALECTGACRVDVLVTEGENEYVLEVNTLPGMTATSLLPKIAASAGLPYDELCEVIAAGARLHSAIPQPGKGATSGRKLGAGEVPVARTA